MEIPLDQNITESSSHNDNSMHRGFEHAHKLFPVKTYNLEVLSSGEQDEIGLFYIALGLIFLEQHAPSRIIKHMARFVLLQGNLHIEIHHSPSFPDKVQLPILKTASVGVAIVLPASFFDKTYKHPILALSDLVYISSFIVDYHLGRYDDDTGTDLANRAVALQSYLLHLITARHDEVAETNLLHELKSIPYYLTRYMSFPPARLFEKYLHPGYHSVLHIQYPTHPELN